MISSLGLGSNLDLNGIIDQLIAVESLPLSVLAQQEGQYQAKLSGLGQIKSTLASFESAVAGLSSSSDSDKYTATSGDPDVFTATASSSATPGEYSISVSQLASSQRLVATGHASLPLPWSPRAADVRALRAARLCLAAISSPSINSAASAIRW